MRRKIFPFAPKVRNKVYAYREPKSYTFCAHEAEGVIITYREFGRRTSFLESHQYWVETGHLWSLKYCSFAPVLDDETKGYWILLLKLFVSIFFRKGDLYYEILTTIYPLLS